MALDEDFDAGAEEGALVANIAHFARVLRTAGFNIGPARVLDVLEAVRVVGIADRRDFYWALRCVFVARASERELFDQAFHIFWRNPRLLERALALAMPDSATSEVVAEPVNRRLGEALSAGAERSPSSADDEGPSDATPSWSNQELLQGKDFEQMSGEEMALVKRVIAKLRLRFPRFPSRRYQMHARGNRFDMRTTLRHSLRGGPGVISLAMKRRRVFEPPLVILCDISGSMSVYSRMLLHFVHAIMSDRSRVHAFVFGTRLTNISRAFAEKDVDLALERVALQVDDWSGGTRIGACLRTFNRHWSRRVLGQGALVWLISDGLDRDAGEGVAREAERLSKSCRKLVWLNPLMRFAGFAPRALGMRALAPHVDELRTVHNLKSLEDLGNAFMSATLEREQRT